MKQVEELKNTKRDLDAVKSLGTAAMTKIKSIADKKQARGKDFLSQEKKDVDAVVIRMQQQLLEARYLGTIGLGELQYLEDLIVVLRGRQFSLDKEISGHDGDGHGKVKIRSG